MNVSFYSSAHDFLGKADSFLCAAPVEHNLIYGLCRAASKIPVRFLTVQDENGDIILAAAQPEGRNIVISRGDLGAAEYLAEKIAQDKTPVSGIVGPSDMAAAFSDRYAATAQRQPVEFVDQLIYSLKNVLMPLEVAGQMRLAHADEESIVTKGIIAFAEAALPKGEQPDMEQAAKRARDAIADRRMYVWDIEGKIVSQAFVAGTEDVARITMVYTPEEHRCRGYACRLVAELSQRMLDEGKKCCALYADARNPVSNAIYRKIGYEFVGRASLYVLEKSQT